MNCKDIEPDLALAASDCLDAARALEIRKHCANCPECASRLEQFQRVASDHRHAANELDGLGLRHEPSAARPGQGETRLGPGLLNPVLRWLLPVRCRPRRVPWIVRPAWRPIGMPWSNQAMRRSTRSSVAMPIAFSGKRPARRRAIC